MARPIRGKRFLIVITGQPSVRRSMNKIFSIVRLVGCLCFEVLHAACSEAPISLQTPIIMEKLSVDSTYTVNREKWFYGRLDTVEVLAEANDKYCREILEHSAMLPYVAHAIFPNIPKVPSRGTLVIVCDSDESFGKFVPRAVRESGANGLVDRLFLRGRCFSRERIIVLRRALPEELIGQLADIARDYVASTLRSTEPALPDWFLVGAAEIVADAAFSRDRDTLHVEFAKLDAPVLDNFDLSKALEVGGDRGRDYLDALGSGTAGNFSRPSIYDRLSVSVEVKDAIRGAFHNKTGNDQSATYQKANLRFNEYFVQRSRYPDFASVLEGGGGLNPDDYRMMCWLFTYQCCFATADYRAKFAALIGESKSSEFGSKRILFERCFGITATQMTTVLASNVGISSRGLVTATACRNVSFAVAETDLGSSAQLVAEGLLAAGNIAGASEVLRVAQAGMGAKSAQARLSQARLQLTSYLLTSLAGSKPIPAAQSLEILGRLFALRSESFTPSDLYDTIADIWSCSELHPQPDHLGVLIEGVNKYGSVRPDYVYRTMLLHSRFGYEDQAKQLARVGVAIDRAEGLERFTRAFPAPKMAK